MNHVVWESNSSNHPKETWATYQNWSKSAGSLNLKSRAINKVEKVGPTPTGFQPQGDCWKQAMNSFSYLFFWMFRSEFETSDELRAAITKHTEMKPLLSVTHPFPDYAPHVLWHLLMSTCAMVLVASMLLDLKALSLNSHPHCSITTLTPFMILNMSQIFLLLGSSPFDCSGGSWSVLPIPSLFAPMSVFIFPFLPLFLCIQPIVNTSNILIYLKCSVF